MKAKQLKKVLSITLASAVILSAVPVSPVIVEAESEEQKQEKETKEKTAAASQAEENKEEKPVEEKTEEKIYLIFGKESTGIPKEILKGHIENCIRIPTTDGVRSLNLSNCVAIGVYEVIKQQNYAHLLTDEPFKGKDYLERE